MKICDTLTLFGVLALVAACSCQGQDRRQAHLGPAYDATVVQAVDTALRDFFSDLDHPQKP